MRPRPKFAVAIGTRARSAQEPAGAQAHPHVLWWIHEACAVCDLCGASDLSLPPPYWAPERDATADRTLATDDTGRILCDACASREASARRTTTAALKRGSVKATVAASPPKWASALKPIVASNPQAPAATTGRWNHFGGDSSSDSDDDPDTPGR